MRMFRQAKLLAFAAMIVPITAAAFESKCSTRIEVVFAQAAGNPRNPQLTSLTDSPGYTLTWVEGKAAATSTISPAPARTPCAATGSTCCSGTPRSWNYAWSRRSTSSYAITSACGT